MFVFSNILRVLRTERGINQSVIADALGVSMQSYSAYENGREPNYDILIKIADYFDVTTDYLLGNSPYRNDEEKTIELESGSERAIDKFSIEIYRLVSECYLHFECLYEQIYNYSTNSDEKVFPKMNSFINGEQHRIMELNKKNQ